MATEKRQKVPGSGRKSGTKNILPPIGKSARETLLNILAFDDEAVARGQLNGKGISARQRLHETLNGLRPATPMEFLAYMKFVYDRAIGTPTKQGPTVAAKEPFLFINYRYGHDPMGPKTTAMLEAKQQEERLLALEAGGREDPETILAALAAAEAKKDGTAEELEIVVPPLEPYEFGPVVPVRERDRAPRGER